MQSELEINIKTAILWQLQHLVKNLTNTKFLNAAQTETEKIFEKSKGEDYRKYLVKILLKEIDFTSSNQKETAKLNLLKPNLVKIIQSPHFLSSYIYELFPEIPNLLECYSEVLKHLKMKFSEELAF